MADTALELDAQRVRQLEAEAVAMHHLAQKLNKEGRFEEAKVAYASMHRLEDEASELAARVGCVACVLGEPGQEDEQPSLCNLDPAMLVPYERLHPAPPWPSGCSLSPEELAARSAGCAVGSLLADAAAMGVHWVYDLDLMDEIEGERLRQAATAVPPSAPPPAHPFAFGLEFLDPPRSPFYAYPSGRNSPYGEQTLALLQSLAESGGLHCGHYAGVFFRVFGPSSGFEGYRDVSTKGFLRNYARGMMPPLSGADDFQANCVARLAPLVAAFASAPATETGSGSGGGGGGGGGGGAGAESGLLESVHLATRVTQNTDAAVSWATAGALALELMLLGSTAEAAVRHVVHDLESPDGRLAPYAGALAPELAGHLTRVLELRTTPVKEAVLALGRNCHMPNALQTPLQVVLFVEHLVQERTAAATAAAAADGRSDASSSGRFAILPAEAYQWGVRLALREGGCCASRAAYTGACLGALVSGPGGAVGLPEEWLRRYTAVGQVQSWAAALVETRRKASSPS